jgi:hypothetical protein
MHSLLKQSQTQTTCKDESVNKVKKKKGKSPPKADDAGLKYAIACVVKDRATYDYRRVWARLKIDGRHARSITNGFTGSCEMKDGCCLNKVKSLWTPRSMKAQWPRRKATRAGALMDWNCLAITGSESTWHLHWTAATG